MADLSIAPDARIYLRPVDFVDAPQAAGRESTRLAGTMMWFAGIEIWAMRDGDAHPARRHVPLDRWEAALASLPDKQRERAETLFTRLTGERVPLTLGERTIRFDTPQVMGIVNMTPDSFSDGGAYTDVDSAALAAADMASGGAAIIDIGGESTRPGAPLIWEGDEIKRVVPLIERLSGGGLALSVDTRKAAVMEAALAAGAHLVNDISGLVYDERGVEVVAGAGAPICIMHAASQSSDPHRNPDYGNVVTDVFDWLEARVEALGRTGLDRTRIVVDPGIGFGKSLADNLAILNNLALFHALGCPLLIGASRKRMIGALSGEAEADRRLGGSVQIAGAALNAGVQLLRVHDVFETVQAVRVWRGLRDAALTQSGVGL